MDPDVTVNTSPYYDGNISFLNEISDDSDIPLFPGYPMVLLQFASACCLLFILLGIPGNLITIIALFRCKKRFKIIDLSQENTQGESCPC
ncbi:hypothetical protein M8J75_006469 [Diaphorina citri]|nr:hypothetical protein M8J75_006469 [Diaphorina citri]KAI5731790.1 hypothetical protein M8J77_016016 [Diaphorina citri]